MRGFNDLESVYDTSQFLGMTFYFGEPYSTPEGNSRANWYGVSGTPNVMLGGTVNEVGGTGSGSMYPYYQPTVASQMGVPSPLIMSASYVLSEGTDIVLTLDIDVDLALSGNNQVQFFICQEGLHNQSNMVVDMLPGEPFSLTTPGQSVTINRTFQMAPGWNEPDLRVIMVVQNMTTKVIHQAAVAEADFAGQVVINAEPDGVEAPWTLVGPYLDLDGNSDRLINLWEVGEYSITWDDIPYWTTPANNPESQTVTEDGVLNFSGVYTDGPFTASTDGGLGDTGPGRAVSMIDFDGDGDLDIHVANEGAADQLLQNDGTGAFTDIATGPIAEPGPSRGSAWADINGDGFLDVYVTRFEQDDILLIGDGSGGFTTATVFGADLTGPGSSVSWVDFDLDNMLDLYVVREGEANGSYKSLGGAGLSYVFGIVAGAQEDIGNGSAAVWTDGDLNGRLDLFIANQFNNNAYLENIQAGFSNITMSSGLGENLGKAIGATSGDYDNDGDFDLYVANEGMADLLYRATGPFQFTQMAGPNLGDRGDGRGATWVDFNNDTFLDLYVVRNDMTDLMLMGDGAGNFTRVPVGTPEASGPGNAVACGDVDNDGDIDIFISREDATNVLFRNEMPNDNHWVKMRLTGLGTNTCAIGARVVVTADGVSQTRLVTSGSGYLCNNAMDVHFGMGSSRLVDRIDIYWPDGTHQVVESAPVDRSYDILQGQSPSPVEDVIPVRATTLGLAHPNPFNPSTTIEFSLAKAEGARLDIYTIDGRHIRTLVDRNLSVGPHQVVWNGADQAGRSVGSGTYFFRLTTASGFSEAGRMVLVK